MSSKTVSTPKGTELPLTNLKGKDYLMVAYRIQWMNEEVPNFEIETEILKMEKDESVVKAKVALLNKDGTVIKKAQATKREDSKGFADHLEKAETSAIGRALALLGFGTQFAVADLDEGQRLADSPLASPKPASGNFQQGSTDTAPTDPSKSNTTTANSSSFRKPKAPAKSETPKETSSTDEGWQ